MDRDRQNTAATTIQSTWRMHRVKQHLNRAKQELEAVLSALPDLPDAAAEPAEPAELLFKPSRRSDQQTKPSVWPAETKALAINSSSPADPTRSARAAPQQSNDTSVPHSDDAASSSGAEPAASRPSPLTTVLALPASKEAYESVCDAGTDARDSSSRSSSSNSSRSEVDQLPAAAPLLCLSSADDQQQGHRLSEGDEDASSSDVDNALLTGSAAAAVTSAVTEVLIAGQEIEGTAEGSCVSSAAGDLAATTACEESREPLVTEEGGAVQQQETEGQEEVVGQLVVEEYLLEAPPQVEQHIQVLCEADQQQAQQHAQAADSAAVDPAAAAEASASSKAAALAPLVEELRRLLGAIEARKAQLLSSRSADD